MLLLLLILKLVGDHSHGDSNEQGVLSWEVPDDFPVLKHIPVDLEGPGDHVVRDVDPPVGLLPGDSQGSDDRHD